MPKDNPENKTREEIYGAIFHIRALSWDKTDGIYFVMWADHDREGLGPFYNYDAAFQAGIDNL